MIKLGYLLVNVFRTYLIGAFMPYTFGALLTTTGNAWSILNSGTKARDIKRRTVLRKYRRYWCFRMPVGRRLPYDAALTDRN